MRVTKADAREQKTKLDNVSEILKTGELIVISETLQIDLNRAKFAKWKYERKGRRRAAGGWGHGGCRQGRKQPKEGGRTRNWRCGCRNEHNEICTGDYTTNAGNKPLERSRADDRE